MALLRSGALVVSFYRDGGNSLGVAIDFVPSRRKLAFPSHLYPPDLPLSSVHIALLDSAIVQIKTAKCQTDTERLYGMNTLREPHDSSTDDGDPLNEGRDAVRHWRRPRQDNKGKNVLKEMHRAVRNKVWNDT